MAPDLGAVPVGVETSVVLVELAVKMMRPPPASLTLAPAANPALPACLAITPRDCREGCRKW